MPASSIMAMWNEASRGLSSDQRHNALGYLLGWCSGEFLAHGYITADRFIIGMQEAIENERRGRPQ